MVNSVSVQVIRMKFQKASVTVSGTGMDVLVMALVAPRPISMRSPFLVALRNFSMCFRVSKKGASGAADPKDFPVKKSTVHGTASLTRGTPPMGPPEAMTWRNFFFHLSSSSESSPISRKVVSTKAPRIHHYHVAAISGFTSPLSYKIYPARINWFVTRFV